VFRAKNATATEVAQLLEQVLREKSGLPLRIVADPGTNSVIVKAANANQLKMVEALMRAIDVPRTGTGRANEGLKVYTLKHHEADANLQAALQVVRVGQGRFALDTERKQVIVFGNEEFQMSIGQLLENLDRPPDRARPEEEMQVRVVWLASGLDPKEAGPPADLKDVLEELARIGVEGPRLVSQTLVNATPGARFSVQGSAVLAQPCQLAISGVIQPGRNNVPNLQIRINAVPDAAAQVPGGVGPGRRGGDPFGAARGGANPPGYLVETQISAPLGHSVVLGVTPTDSLTSVFVVQVLPRKPVSRPPVSRPAPPRKP
jgi:hypothetical protein